MKNDGFSSLAIHCFNIIQLILIVIATLERTQHMIIQRCCVSKPKLSSPSLNYPIVPLRPALFSVLSLAIGSDIVRDKTRNERELTFTQTQQTIFCNHGTLSFHTTETMSPGSIPVSGKGKRFVTSISRTTSEHTNKHCKTPTNTPLYTHIHKVTCSICV